MSDEKTVQQEKPTGGPEFNGETPKDERVGDFIKEYGELVKKHEIDFASYPVFVPDGQGGFKIVVQNTPVDIRNQPVKSPFMAQE